MDRLVDHLFVFEGDGFVRDFPGNYSIYRSSLKPDQTAEEKTKIVSSKKTVTDKRKFSFNEKREWEILQKEIMELEGEKHKLSDMINKATLPYEDLMKISGRIAEINGLLDLKEMRWLELSEIAE
jgi:ATP-binding cassette subfamily F protein uup